MKKSESGTQTGRAGKLRRGRPPLNEIRTLVVDGIGAVPPDAAMQDACVRSYLKLGSIQAVAESIGISVGLAHRHIKEGSAYLREAGTPEHRAAVLGLVEGRVNGLWRTVDGAITFCTASGQVEKIAALAAVGGRLCELMARFHGVGGNDAAPALVDVARAEEVQRRLMLVGPHSKAGRAAAANAMKIADIVVPDRETR
jgi:hypothetical protein